MKGGPGVSRSAPVQAPPPSVTTAPQQRIIAAQMSVSSNVSENEKVYEYVLWLCREDKREQALLELSKRRENFADLAPLLWHSFGTLAALLQEIVSIYPNLSPPALTAQASNRVCNSLALLQCVASHTETRKLFLQAHIPLFLYPFLNTVSKSRPFEYLRLTSLGVIGALVKVDDSEVINFLLQTEIIPLCLRIMETGSELSKTVATFIVQKILLDAVGLEYICATAERFYAVSTVLSGMLRSLVESPSPRLLKHIVRCYLRLSDNFRAREALRQTLPEQLQDKTFSSVLRDDATTKKWLQQLIMNVNGELAYSSLSVGPNRSSSPPPSGHPGPMTQQAPGQSPVLLPQQLMNPPMPPNLTQQQQQHQPPPPPPPPPPSVLSQMAQMGGLGGAQQPT